MIALLIIQTISTSYVGIFDAGSSGTRVYLYQYENASDPGTFTHVKYQNANVYKKVNKPLAAAFNNSDKIKEIFDGTLDYLNATLYSLSIDPKSVSIILFCTAGMRKLPIAEQESILDDSYDYIIGKYLFTADRNEFRVIVGYEEALFAWIGVNRWINVFNASKTFPIFEMGGASAQIAIEQTKSDSDTSPLTHTVTIAKKVYNVFCHSWLGFGYDDAVATVHQYLFNNSIVDTPCAINGSILTLKLSDGLSHTFNGISNFSKCYELFSELVFVKNNNTLANHEYIFTDIPLSDDFELNPEVYVLGIPSYAAAFFNLPAEENVSVLKINSTSYGEMDYSAAYQYSNGYSYLNASFSQQIAALNFIERGLNPMKKFIYKLPVSDAEPQWTLGAVLSARSPAITIEHPAQEKTSTWIYIGSGVGGVSLLSTLGYIFYPRKSQVGSEDSSPPV